MHRLFKLIVGQRGLVLVLALALIGAGLWNLSQLAVDAVPDISPKQVMILTQANGLGPLDVERLVTAPVENQMTGLPLLQDVRSVSHFGLSAVYVTFKDSADVQTARAEVFQRLQLAQAMLPPGIGTPEESPFATGLGEIMEFELRGPGYTPMQLYQMLQWTLVPQLRLVPGVVNVDIYGGQLQTYQVQPSPEAMLAHGVTLPDLFSALESNNTARGGAYLDRGDEQEIIRGLALAKSTSDIAAIGIRTAPGGAPITVGDVANVKLAPKVRLGAVTHDGQGETLVGVVDMQYGLNTSQVLPGVKAKLAELRQQLPPGMGIDVFYDRSKLIQRAIHTVAHNLGEGALLVVGVLLLTLGSVRAGLIVATVIPLAMMIAFAGMRLFGISGNLMSLGAIDFGLVVDGAVVLIENVLRRQLEAPNRGDLASIVPKAAAQVAKPVIFSVVIIVSVYVPILALQDVEGKTFRPMALTVMMALAGALLITMLVVPALAALFLSRKPRDGESWLIRHARRGYAPMLGWTTEHPWITGGIAAGLLAGALFLATTLGGEFIPTLQEGTLVVTSNKPPSINLDASLQLVTRIEQVIRSFRDVDKVVSQTGSAAVPTDPMGVQSTDSYVMLKPPGQWTTASTQMGLQDAIEAKLKASIPAVDFEFSQPIRMRMDDLLQGVRTPVSLAIYGPDLRTLRQISDQALKVLNAIKGASNVQDESQGDLPQVTVSIDRARLARYGLSAKDALDVVQAMGGRETGIVYGGDNSETPIVVRLPAADRVDASRIGELPVGLVGGRSVALSEVADVSVSSGPWQIKRDGLRRQETIDIDVEGRDMSSFVAEAQQTVASQVHLPPGYTLEWSGQFKNLRAASATLALMVPIALAVIFLLLYLNFGSLRPALLIFLNVPMAATGGVAALVLRAMPFSVTAGIGFIAVFGVAILDGVVLVSYIEDERQAGTKLKQAARDAAEKRLRPVLTTALVATIGFIPMAVSTTVGAEVQRPLATVVIGGLITATALTLLVLPSLYAPVMSMRWPSRKRRAELVPGE